ncbi:MAG: putative nucleotide binding protein [Methanosaeta sp. ASP1-2]|nr:MAG: putative nucleotide binding protein [Methanosaeta sp. ASP1-2]
MPEGRPPKREEVARVLDYLPYGRAPDSRSFQKQPLVQSVGETNFVLMEMTPKEGVVPAAGTRVYIGGGSRDVIDHVNRRIDYSELSNSAKLELSYEIASIVLDNEARFIRYFNEAGPITTRMHALELLPGIGKKLMWAVLNERKKGPFKSFADLTERVKGLHNPEKLISKRVEDELMDDRIKYRVFTTMPRTR